MGKPTEEEIDEIFQMTDPEFEAYLEAHPEFAERYRESDAALRSVFERVSAQWEEDGTAARFRAVMAEKLGLTVVP